MDADEDLDKLFSEEVLSIIMTEPIDPTPYVRKCGGGAGYSL